MLSTRVDGIESLQMMAILASLRRATGVVLSNEDVLSQDTVWEVIAMVREAQMEGGSEEQEQESSLPSFRRLRFFNGFVWKSVAWLVKCPPGVDVPALKRACTKVAERHVAFRAIRAFSSRCT
jgi:hypothetical protein